MNLSPEVLKRMKEVEQVVLDLHESVRGAAFGMFQEYIFGEAPEPVTEHGEGRSATENSHDDAAAGSARPVGEFFRDRDLKKPSDAVYATVGYLYSQYGTEPFSAADIQNVADQVGLTVPARIDMSLRNAKRKGKALFQSSRDGTWRLTTAGEVILKEMFDITKGTKKRVPDDEGDL
jgi:hypothetical protein